MEFWKCFGFQKSLFFLIKIQEFSRIFDKIYNPYNKTPQKFLEFFKNHGQVKYKKARCQKG